MTAPKIAPAPERRMLNKTLASAYLGISIRSLEMLAKDGKLLKTPINGRVLFDKADLDAYIDAVKRSA